MKANLSAQLLKRFFAPVLQLLICGNAIAALPLPFVLNNDIAPRLQWNANNGYCGEVSFMNAGLYYGQYVSQYDLRAIASQNKAQNLNASQLLLGVNDVFTASQLRLNFVAWKTASGQSSSSFLAWVKSNVISGFPVVIGVFMNHNKFYASDAVNAGDPDYDHIVTVLGLESRTSLGNPSRYYSDDVLKFSDHGLWTGGKKTPQYLFSHTFGTFQGTRQQANASTAQVYTLPLGNNNYGIALTGVMDTDRSTVPVRLSTSSNAELPAMKEGSNVRPAAAPLTLTVTVSDLKPNVVYNLYRYSSVSAVPNAAFNRNAAKASQKWRIKITSGSSYVFKLGINSNETAVFRAVPSTAL